MKGFFAQLWKGFQILCVTAVVLVAVLAIYLFATGALSKDRVTAAWLALRGKTPEPKVPTPESVDAEWKKLEDTREKTELTLRKREEELKSLEARTKLDLAQLEIERRTLNDARAEAEKSFEALKKERAEFEAKKIDAVTKSNLPIFEEMKGQDLSALMAGWPDADVIKYLRLLSPEKAAEVLKVMGQAPKDSPWKVLPENAPKGTKNRYEKIADALKG